MSSEHRLHPYSVLFAFLTSIRLFVVPGLLVVIGASSGGRDWMDWQPWFMLLVIPNAAYAIVRYMTYVYRYEDSELVIRSGLLFRRERHIPYARIQNIDAVQNVLHRLLHVVEVRLETGGGESAEARMSVLPLSALEEMRLRVAVERHGVPPVSGAAADVPLLQLDLRELLLCGLLENRGGVLVAAAFGLVWEFGLADRLVRPFIGEQEVGRGLIRGLVRSVVSSATVSWDRIALAVAALLAVLVAMRVVSMIWAVVRLYGFRLSMADAGVRSEFGLFTRVAVNIPLRRVQLLSAREGPLHRLCGRVAVRVDTAGGHQGEEQADADREYLAPILRRERLRELVRVIVDVDLADVAWQAPHRRAFRRELVPALVVAAVICAASVAAVRWYALPVMPLMLVWAVVTARQTVRHMRWASTDEAVFVQSGWLWRRTIVARVAKAQVVSLEESPFDRRHGMASVHVDTAGASAGTAVDVPYLSHTEAWALHARLARAAGDTQFQW